MPDIYWVYIVYLLGGIPSSFILLKVYIERRQLSLLVFSLSLIAFLLSILIALILPEHHDIARDWGDIISITCVLNGLFIKIRNSKPVFARFPIYLTLLPFLSLIFYPLIIDSDIIKDILKAMYQGGAIIVGFLVVSINHYMYKSRSVLLIGCISFTISYVLAWIFPTFIILNLQWAVILFFVLGMLLSSFGFKRIGKTKNAKE